MVLLDSYSGRERSTTMNIVTVSCHRRPVHTRLCLESLARAQRWYRWADKLTVCLSANGSPDVGVEALQFANLNPDIPFEIWQEPHSIGDPHVAAKWMLDKAFEEADICLYVEDDVVFSPDAFVMLAAVSNGIGPTTERILGCCLYHETIPEQYQRESREPDPTLLHLSNGLNTCGGTAFFREPYLEYLSPNWNCKQVEPKGFDYSAHYLMFIHKLFMVWPDFSRSLNNGFELGSCAPAFWQQYFGKSMAIQTSNALKRPEDFRLSDNPAERRLVREAWMCDELRHRGLDHLL